MSKSSISQYFNPDQHLVLHQDKDGNMIGGGYQVNNLLYQHKMPLFVSLDDTERQKGGGGGSGGGGGEDDHFIPEKFSDLFRDLAVPAGLFMMPALFKPRNYAFEVPEQEEDKRDDAERDANANGDRDANADSDSDSDSDSDGDSDGDSDDQRRKPVPIDIFDRLLELVSPSERVQHDVKTRRRRPREKQQQQRQHSNNKKLNTTKRTRGRSRDL
jgi:hypothetical protein